ncbi:MAG: hypothetical protein LR011_03580 [Verrucomicrobia bacterium]|nr:hypothetical protein [Verrucomicrobiota bacterium]
MSITADEAVSNSLAEQIKLTARAYPLFSIAQMILGKPERYVFKLASVKKKGSDDAAQKLFQCALDETVWLNQSDAIDHLMKNHLGTFYETVKTASEPPKGTYTFVAQCGMSGVILGPPNYHDYQNQLRNLYNERFEKKMSFDRFKSRVKIVKDEETVKKWLDEQSFVTTYRVLNSPEQLILESWTQVLEHFNENHLPNLIVEISKHTIPGAQADNYPCPQIRRLIRVRLQEQKRFPLKVVHLLSQQFSTRGLQFFKVNKTVTHVCVSRPHYLDLDSTNVKDGIRRIIDFIQSHPGCNRKQLVDTLVTMEIPVAESSPVFEPAETVQPSESAENPPAPESSESVQAAQETTSKPAVASSSEPSAAQKAIISDLHWLLYQGNVIEFASGVLEVAKKPLEKKKAPAAAPKVASEPVSDAVAPADTPSGIQETSGELPPSDTEIQAEPAESVSDFGADNVQCDNGGEQITFESPTPATDQSADTEAPRPAQDSNSQPNNPV